MLLWLSPGNVSQHATGWLSPLEYVLWKRATSLQTMSALLSSQSISGAPAASPLPSARRCSWSAAAAAFARHCRGRAWCCCCVAGAAVSGVGDSLLVAACRTVAVAGTLLAESLRLQRVECLSEIMSTYIVFHAQWISCTLLVEAALWQAVGSLHIWHPLWRQEVGVQI